jgi:hypothetical protein
MPNQQVEEFDLNKKDLFIAAAVNNSIEIYKIQPTVERLCTNLTTKRTRTNSSSQSQSSSSQTSLRARKNSIRNNNPQQQQQQSNLKQHSTQSNTNTRASANIVVLKSINLLNEKENNNQLENDKLKHDDNTDESIDTLAMSKAFEEQNASDRSQLNSKILLCAATSKGNIHIWQLSFNDKSTLINDSNNNNKENIIGHSAYTANQTNCQISATKLKVLKEAHGKQEIDELQVKFAFHLEKFFF